MENTILKPFESSDKEILKSFLNSVVDHYNLPKVYLLALYAQAVHETGNFQSTLYDDFQNSFGMKVAQTRKQNNLGSVTLGNETFATFRSDWDSLLDRISLDDFNGVERPIRISDVTRYMTEVANKGYATDPNYLNKWKNIFENVTTQSWVNDFLYTDEYVKGLNFNPDVDTVILTDAKGFSKWYLLLVLGGTTAIAIYLYRLFKKKKQKKENLNDPNDPNDPINTNDPNDPNDPNDLNNQKDISDHVKNLLL